MAVIPARVMYGMLIMVVIALAGAMTIIACVIVDTHVLPISQTTEGRSFTSNSDILSDVYRSNPNFNASRTTEKFWILSIYNGEHMSQVFGNNCTAADVWGRDLYNIYNSYGNESYMCLGHAMALAELYRLFEFNAMVYTFSDHTKNISHAVTLVYNSGDEQWYVMDSHRNASFYYKENGTLSPLESVYKHRERVQYQNTPVWRNCIYANGTVTMRLIEELDDMDNTDMYNLFFNEAGVFIDAPMHPVGTITFQNQTHWFEIPYATPCIL